ncbi:MAG: PIG-L deacetylase family protein [Actinomycetales bacterium]
MGDQPKRTIVAFHAHPDDEALLTGGTLAMLAAQGHRVVLVVATDGEAGLASDSAAGADLGRTRVTELEAATTALGCARVVRLGLPDSGWSPDGRTEPDGFSRLPVSEAAEPLLQVLRAEQADILIGYDAAGGYGHPDHKQVHLAGHLAAELAGTPCVLEATLPREPLLRLVRIGARVPGLLDVSDVRTFEQAFTPRGQITHRVDVHAQLGAKRAALQAHASQASADSGPRTLALLLRLPGPLFRLVAGTEWFTDRSRHRNGLAEEVLGRGCGTRPRITGIRPMFSGTPRARSASRGSAR